jgi:hypothetical protein
MEQVRFYNSLTKQLEPFTPRDAGKVRIYHCGPTVYKRQHIGNMRRFLFADTLRRSLEFLGYEVREILWPLQGDHETACFTYVAKQRRHGHVIGERYPITYQGLKTQWRRGRKRARAAPTTRSAAAPSKAASQSRAAASSGGHR